MCDKTILENSGTLNSVSDSYKNQKICNQAVDNYSHILEFVPNCYNEALNKAVDTSPSTI